MTHLILRTAVLLTGLAFVAPIAMPLVTPVAQAATDKKDPGRKLYRTKTCSACHGRAGRKAMLDYPNIAGQDERYIVRQINDIIAGKRLGSLDATGNPRSQGMRGALVVPVKNTPTITKDEIKLMAKWLSKQTPADLKPPKTPLDPASVAAGKDLYKKKCKSCHGAEGKKPTKGNPYVVGQKRAYLMTQMLDIQSRARKTPKLAGMYGVVKKMSEEQFGNLADYLSQVDRNAAK